ncbi:MAG: helix-turn-helix transcriptional regulator [Desulfovibrionaceae bacterium]|nr:helix-turn-helix transcriptional regulator [Desulfovibrionaceae bacterium]
MSTIAERFLILRGKGKQGDFAKELGINPNTLRNYENGRVFPNQEILERICVKFSVSPEWLLLGQGSMRPNDQSEAPCATSADVQHTETIEQNTCPRCAELKKELSEEREERRELARENRQLWKENAALREENAMLRATTPPPAMCDNRKIA